MRTVSRIGIELGEDNLRQGDMTVKEILGEQDLRQKVENILGGLADGPAGWGCRNIGSCVGRSHIGRCPT